MYTSQSQRVEMTSIQPEVNPDDASGYWSYHIVLVNNADEDLNLALRPSSTRVAKYNVYITHEVRTRCSVQL